MLSQLHSCLKPHSVDWAFNLIDSNIKIAKKILLPIVLIEFGFFSYNWAKQ